MGGNSKSKGGKTRNEMERKGKNKGEKELIRGYTLENSQSDTQRGANKSLLEDD